MHPITAETPFHLLWPQSRKRRPAKPNPRLRPPTITASCVHDFLLLNARPDLCEPPPPPASGA
ncbi:MAG: hypothetical protein IT582_02040 [Opitutaceae bacterium]|nr:hypothetical protein [Opitutaceae bacterium]